MDSILACFEWRREKVTFSTSDCPINHSSFKVKCWPKGPLWQKVRRDGSIKKRETSSTPWRCGGLRSNCWICTSRSAGDRGAPPGIELSVFSESRTRNIPGHSDGILTMVPVSLVWWRSWPAGVTYKLVLNLNYMLPFCMASIRLNNVFITFLYALDKLI